MYSREWIVDRAQHQVPTFEADSGEFGYGPDRLKGRLQGFTDARDARHLAAKKYL